MSDEPTPEIAADAGATPGQAEELTNQPPKPDIGIHLKKTVVITTQFTALHRWVDAPPEVHFLGDPHRHIFHVKVYFEVRDSDREVEFFMAKRDINAYLAIVFPDTPWMKVHNASCEQFAELILGEIVRWRKYYVTRVEVWEDGENGAIVEVLD